MNEREIGAREPDMSVFRRYEKKAREIKCGMRAIN
jgi:hypothetical protein